MKSLTGLVITVSTSLFILFNISTSYAGDLLTDSLALVALYDSTDGDNWTNNTGWKADTLGAWYGIELRDGRVVNIYLQGNNLNGCIPPDIGDIDSLERIDFNGNIGLTDSLPAEIGNLSKLERLYIYSSGLTGSIPPELGNLTSIRDIALDRNFLTGSIPSTLGDLSNLSYLSLHNNNLSGPIPAQLGNLSSLKTLNLSANPLGGAIPPQLGNMSNLQSLSANSCQLTGSIPIALTNLTELITLDLSFNQLTDSIPSQFGSLSNLQTINFYNNQLSGEIPPELANLTNLQQLSLSANNLTGNIPPELGNLSNLIYLELYGNKLTGSIPAELGNLTKARNFLLADNQLTGSIPAELGNLSKVSLFFIQNNELSGPVPEELTNLTNVTSIFLVNNNLEDLPDLSGLAFLNTFHVYNNKFTFGDLEPNIHVLDSYSPQDSIGTPDIIYFAIEDTLLLVTRTDGLYNNYQWTFNGGDINDNSLYSGTNDSVLRIINPALTDAGVFSCKVTNDTVTGLTLYRQSLHIAPAVKITGLPEITQCADDSMTIEYKSIEVFPGNIFTVELSDSLGNFHVPLIIGSVSNTNSIGTIKVHIPENISTGDHYRVRVNASNPATAGISSTGTLHILNRTLSGPAITPSGNTSFCDGQSVELTTDTLTGLQYVWYKDDAVIEGATTQSFTADEEGLYYVKIYDVCNSDPLPSNMVEITVNPLPAISLTMDGTLLTATSDPDYSYVWFRDQMKLQVDSTEYQYTALENGEYRVLVTDENGCTEISNSLMFTTISGIENTILGMDAFPNPTDGKLYITLKMDIAIKRLIITNVAGKAVFDQDYTIQNAGDTLELDLSDQKPGIYMVYLKTSEDPIYFKLVKY